MSGVVTVLALSSNQSAWLGTLVVGLVVLGVVIVLLELLRRAVLALQKNIWETWMNGKAVVRHTGTSYLLKNTRVSGEELAEELSHHG
ncbi:MAG: hypothetical protein M3296_02300 [Actinomycetota bacterium]|nr:hypothetical protein [Actinomycetota bacterium]